MIKFNYITPMIWNKKKHWVFDCSMISTCAPVFNNCEDNYDVENILRKAKVIRKNQNTDTETCALVSRFSTQKSADNFIDRLNKYLANKGDK